MPEGAEEGIVKGMYLFRRRATGAKARGCSCWARGTILREVIAAAELLEKDFGVAADVWSVPELHRAAPRGDEVERWNLLHPTETPRRSLCRGLPGRQEGPVVASTDYMRLFADQIRPFVPRPLPGARHRRLRPLRLPPQAARLLRGGPPLRGARRAGGAGGGGQRLPAQHSCRGDQPNTASIRKAEPAPRPDARHGKQQRIGRNCQMLAINDSQGSRYRRLQGRAGHRDPCQAGRHSEASTTRSSRSNPTRRPWTCRPPRPARSRRSWSRSATG